MPKHVADLAKRGATTKHLRRRGVTQQMGSSVRWIESRTADGAGHRTANAQTRQATKRSSNRDEEVPSRTGRSSLTRIRSESRADVARQREHVVARALAVHRDLAGSPIDVLDPQCGDLTATKADPDQQRQHGAIATTDRGPEIAGLGRATERPLGFRLSGRSEDPRSRLQLGTVGTQAARSERIRPRCRRKRRKARKAVVISWCGARAEIAAAMAKHKTDDARRVRKLAKPRLGFATRDSTRNEHARAEVAPAIVVVANPRSVCR